MAAPDRHKPSIWIDQAASASARSASRMAFLAASRAPSARIFAPMIAAAVDRLPRFGAHSRALQRALPLRAMPLEFEAGQCAISKASPSNDFSPFRHFGGPELGGTLVGRIADWLQPKNPSRLVARKCPNSPRPLDTSRPRVHHVPWS